MFIFFVVVHHNSCVDMVKIGFPGSEEKNTPRRNLTSDKTILPLKNVSSDVTDYSIY